MEIKLKMIVSEKIRGFISTTAHPDGCFENVRRQVEFVCNNRKKLNNSPRKVLVVGASSGYGLASRISAAFGMGADTIGISYERAAAGNKCASAGWYNTAAFRQLAEDAEIGAYDIIGDAFSREVKERTVKLIKEKFGKIDLLVYSIAAPRRTMPDGTVSSSVLKPIGNDYTSKSIDVAACAVNMVTLEAVADGGDEIRATVDVMGGGDWKDWIGLLMSENLLADGFVTLAYNYIGPKVTNAIYREGTIGRAKVHLEKTAADMSESLKGIGGGAYVSVNKALVTQSSAAIPAVPLYISILFKIMKERGTHEGTIEQMNRMFNDKIYGESGVILDENRLIRMDDFEMDESVQREVADIWGKIDTSNIKELADLDGYSLDFRRLFGFGFDNIDYDSDVDIERTINLA